MTCNRCGSQVIWDVPTGVIINVPSEELHAICQWCGAVDSQREMAAASENFHDEAATSPEYRAERVRKERRRVDTRHDGRRKRADSYSLAEKAVMGRTDISLGEVMAELKVIESRRTYSAVARWRNVHGIRQSKVHMPTDREGLL